MRKKYIIFFIILIALASLILIEKKNLKPNREEVVNVSNIVQTQQEPAQSRGNSQNINDQGFDNTNSGVPTNGDSFQPPMDRASERITKKYFGIYITPKTSPVQPERFQGYHTGTDFETFPDEAKTEVSVRAVCSGKLLVEKNANGYGGVVVQSCTLNGQAITVVYGHLKLSSINTSVGSNISVGDSLGVLGEGYSRETDGERKHLHLGFHWGSAVDILGYVSNKSALSGWIDPCLYVCGK